MNLQIQENNCTDKEVRVLDTRLPYYYNKIKESFLTEPEKVEIEVVNNDEEFNGKVAYTKDNKIFILEPSKFKEKGHKREDFFKILYKEVLQLFYTEKKH